MKIWSPFRRAARAESDQPRTRWQRFSRSWLGSIMIVIVIMLPLRSAVADWNDVPTGSMEPTILPGDRIFVNKMSYGLRVPFTTTWVAQWSEPRPGEIVTFLAPDTGTRLVKRIVAGPGDTVELRNNHLIVNGAAMSYRALPDTALAEIDAGRRGAHEFALELLAGRSHAMAVTPSVRAMRSFGPVTVPVGNYFMLGDNRDVSGDSRYFGFVARERITGRAPAIALSLDPDRWYAPRFGRFFEPLR